MISLVYTLFVEPTELWIVIFDAKLASSLIHDYFSVGIQALNRLLLLYLSGVLLVLLMIWLRNKWVRCLNRFLRYEIFTRQL